MPKSGDAASLSIHDTNSCAQTIPTLGVNGFAGLSTGQARANHGFGLNYSLAVRFRNNGCAYSTTGTCLFPRSSLELNPWTRGFPYLILSCSHRPTHSQCWRQWSGCAAAKEKKRWLSLSLEHTKNTSFFLVSVYQEHFRFLSGIVNQAAMTS